MGKLSRASYEVLGAAPSGLTAAAVGLGGAASFMKESGTYEKPANVSDVTRSRSNPSASAGEGEVRCGRALWQRAEAAVIPHLEE